MTTVLKTQKGPLGVNSAVVEIIPKASQSSILLFQILFIKVYLLS